MNGNKVARVLNRIFSICFFLCMALIFFGTFFYGYTKRTDTNTFGDLNPKRILYSTHAHLIIYFAAVLLLVFFCVLYYLSKKDYRLTAPGKMSNEKKFRIILFTVVGIMLAIELYMGWEMRIYRSHDLAYVGTNSDTFAYTGSFQELRNRRHLHGALSQQLRYHVLFSAAVSRLVSNFREHSSVCAGRCQLHRYRRICFIYSTDRKTYVGKKKGVSCFGNAVYFLSLISICSVILHRYAVDAFWHYWSVLVHSGNQKGQKSKI